MPDPMMCARPAVPTKQAPFMSDSPGSSQPQRATLNGPGPPPRAIVFFDGVCGLCNATVDFWMRRDRNGRLAFAPLQGVTAAGYLAPSAREDLQSMVLRTESGKTFVRSAAAVRILWRLGGIWSVLAALLWLVPLPLRDLGYRLVAASRYSLFGRRETCRLPTADEAERLLP